ncbi:hypothetical protein LIER_22834 [Lithospermum erythrorhizon]|uniref:Retrovirus-related Pol polyprotein from transposon TNT 1-94-like beta-barrel domain-containing protein n=1 Tax=Lithospermum erythrorhizon TaxID=34254 RepID=A0AAV3QYW5_LITER
MSNEKLVECPNYVKRHSKSYCTTLTDDDSEGEEDQEEKATSQSSWYFDSGCSRYTIGKKLHLTKIQYLKGDHVTFGDGGRGWIVGKGQLCMDGLPYLEDVLLVEGLIANLISISQLSDDGMKVFFGRYGCTVNNSCDQTVMKGVRSADDCYM